MNNDNTPTHQPMGFGEVLDTTFSLYREHFLLFLGIISLGFCGNVVEYLLGRFLPNFPLKNFVTDLVSVPFVLISMGGIIVATATIYLGGNITTSREALKQTLHRFWQMLACLLPWSLVFEIPRIGFALSINFMMGTESIQIQLISITLVSSVLFSIHLPIYLGSIIFRLVAIEFIGLGSMWVQFIPLVLAPFAVYFTVRWLFATTVVLVEGSLIRRVFKRSSELTRGRWWQVWGMLISFSVLSFAIRRIVETSVGFILALTKLAGAATPMDIIRRTVMYTPIDADPLFSTIMMWTDFVVATLVFPIWVIGVTLLYFDLRIWKEGFNAEMLVNNTAN